MDEPQITAIDPSARDPLRRVIKVDGEAVVTLDVSQVAELGLRVGQAWDPSLSDRARCAAAKERARRYAMNLLNRRAYASGDLRQRMERKGFDPGVADTVIDRLTEQRLLDDEAFARSLVEQTRRAKPAGRVLLERKLRQKFLPADLIARVLDEADEGYDAAAEARALVERRAATPTLQKADGPTRRRRLWSLLARRGFSPDVIHQALAGMDNPNE